MEVPFSNHLSVLISSHLGLKSIPTVDNFEEEESNHWPASYSPPALPPSFSLSSHIDALNSKFSPSDGKVDKLKYLPISYSLSSLSLDPQKDALSNEKGHSETALEFHYTVPCALPDAEERRRHAETALNHFNKENASNYHLVDAFLSNGLSLWDGTWFHCNFTAKPPSSKVSPKLFYAEVCGSTWTVRGCFILEGETTVGCDMCSNAVHPTHGNLNEHHKYTDLLKEIDRSLFKPYAWPDAEKRRTQAEAAVEYYNKKNAVNYELVDAFLSNGIKSWGDTYFHCNFTAKIPYLDSTPKLFFAEMCNSRVSSCLILEGKTTSGCFECLNVIHPIHGYECGNLHVWMEKMNSRALPLLPTIDRSSYKIIDCFGKPQNFGVPVYSTPQQRYAENALTSFNLKNKTDYKLVASLRCCDLQSDGSWYHINFTAKQPAEGDISPKRFFAEIYGKFGTASACCMLEGETETIDGCIFCCAEIIHPNHGSFLGKHPLKSSDPSITY